MADASFTISVQGSAQAKRMLARWKEPQLSRRAQLASTKGAEVIRRPLQREAARVSERMSKAVRVVKAMRNPPGAVVYFNPEKAPFAHMVVGGTKAHGSRRGGAMKFPGPFGWVVVKRVRGVRPNPMIVRVARAYQQRVFAAMVRSLTKDP